MRTILWAAVAASILATAACSGDDKPKKDADVQVYSARHYGSEDVFKEFTKETGITVEFINDKAGALLERIKVEGDDSPADIFMTVDAGNLWNAVDQGILAAIDSPALESSLDERYRDPEGRWFGLMMRARTVIYNPDKVDPAEFDATDTYSGLTDPKWKGRLCMRDTAETYTSALVAALIDLHGEAEAKEIVEGWVANDVDVMSNDIRLIEAVEAGTCEAAIVNHYYLARNQAEGKYTGVKLFWASQNGAGTMVNVSGAGIVETSDNKADAQKLLEWLASPTGQKAMMEGNHEYPVNTDVQPDAAAAAFGTFTPMPLDAEAYGKLNAAALDLLAEAGYK